MSSPQLRALDEQPWQAGFAPDVAAVLSLWFGAASRWPTIRNYHFLFDHARRVVRSLDADEALRDLRRRFHVHLALTAPKSLHPPGRALRGGPTAATTRRLRPGLLSPRRPLIALYGTAASAPAIRSFHSGNGVFDGSRWLPR